MSRVMPNGRWVYGTSHLSLSQMKMSLGDSGFPLQCEAQIADFWARNPPESSPPRTDFFETLSSLSVSFSSLDLFCDEGQQTSWIHCIMAAREFSVYMHTSSHLGCLSSDSHITTIATKMLTNKDKLHIFGVCPILMWAPLSPLQYRWSEW